MSGQPDIPCADGPCPLCGAAVLPYARNRLRAFVRCSVCGLISVPKSWHATPEAEKRRYDLHRNDPSDAGYVRFLSQLADAIAPRLTPGSEGLDFGSGPSPVLSRLMEGQGFKMRTFDPFYANDRAATARSYDFVVCSEVVEHFRSPSADWDLLVSLVRPGGWLGVMTSLWEGAPEKFVRWRYACDETHLAFYSDGTMAWIARRFGVERVSQSGPVALFRNQMTTGGAMPGAPDM